MSPIMPFYANKAVMLPAQPPRPDDRHLCFFIREELIMDSAAMFCTTEKRSRIFPAIRDLFIKDGAIYSRAGYLLFFFSCAECFYHFFNDIPLFV